MKIVVACFLVLLSVYAVCAEFVQLRYRPPLPGDAGDYYLVDSQFFDDGQFTVLSRRIGKNDAYTDFTRVDINCLTMQYRAIAYLSVDGLHEQPVGQFNDWSAGALWTSLVRGSSKSDLVEFICLK